jgi:regulator of replication initiation timing
VNEKNKKNAMEVLQEMHKIGELSRSSLLKRAGVRAVKYPVHDYSKPLKDPGVYGPNQLAISAEDQQRLQGELMSVMSGTAHDAQQNRAIDAIRRADELLGQVEQAKRSDPLLVATIEVLADENSRLNGENERLSQENEALRRRLDEAHDRLYKTIDILQEKLHGNEEATRGGEQPSAAGEQKAPGECEGARADEPRTLSVVGEA